MRSSLDNDFDFTALRLSVLQGNSAIRSFNSKLSIALEGVGEHLAVSLLPGPGPGREGLCATDLGLG